MHALANAAVFLKVLFLRGDHAIEKKARLINDDDHQIRDRRRRTRLEKRLPIRPLIMLLTELAGLDFASVVSRPFDFAVGFQVIEIIFE